MKTIISLLVWACGISIALAQTTIEKSQSVSAGNEVVMDFTWPELITIRTWDKNEVKVIGKVSINNGENDDAFKLEMTKEGNRVMIESSIPNMEDLPHKITISSNGKKYYFDGNDRNSKEIQAFKKEHGDSYEYMNYGPDLDIKLEVFVPQTVKLDVYSKFGMIEVKGFEGQMNVNSKFGGVDITAGHKGELKAGTKFGNKYSNLTRPVQTISLGDHPGKWDWISYQLNGGDVKQEVKSEFGNIYIREL